MVRSTAEKDGAEFHDDEDSAEQTDDGAGGGDGPRLNGELQPTEKIEIHYSDRESATAV